MGGEHSTTQPDSSRGSEIAAPIQARGIPSQLPAETSDVIMWMPGGTHEITASKKGQPVTLSVSVTRETATVAQQALRRHLAAGRQRPYFDFNHRGGEASAWVKAFHWGDYPEPGVYAEVEWSAAGKQAVDGKIFRAFSPSFFADAGDPARVTGAPLNMGGLVNDPAFDRIATLWAHSPNNSADQKIVMTETEKAAANAAAGNANTNAAVQAASGNAAANAGTVIEIQDATSALRAKDTELSAARAENSKLADEVKAMRTRQAASAIEAAVARGAIPAQAEDLKKAWRSQIEANPDAAQLLSAISGNPALSASRITQAAVVQASGVQITREDTRVVIKAYGMEKDPRKRGFIYAADLRKRIAADEDMPIDAANTLGTTATDIVSQRVLDLLVEYFPEIRRISTDLSSEAINLKFGKTINVSLLTPPTAGTYHTTNGYVSQSAVATSVPVACDRHKFVQHEFNAEELSGSQLNLFTRHAPGMAYALGLEFVTFLYSLIVKASFTTETIRTLANFDRTGVVALGTALNKRNVPKMNRTLLLNSDYCGQLFEDPAIVSLASFNQPDIITRGRLPDVHGFTPFEAQSLPTAENLVGFAFTPDSLAMVARIPSEYATALPGVTGGGVVSTIVEPNTGLSCQKVDFVDHQKGFAYSRLAWMYGAAKGQVASGQRLVSAAS